MDGVVRYEHKLVEVTQTGMMPLDKDDEDGKPGKRPRVWPFALFPKFAELEEQGFELVGVWGHGMSGMVLFFKRPVGEVEPEIEAKAKADVKVQDEERKKEAELKSKKKRRGWLGNN